MLPTQFISLKGEFANFFIGQSDAPKYDIIWSEKKIWLISSFQRYWRSKCVYIVGPTHFKPKKGHFLALLGIKNV